MVSDHGPSAFECQIHDLVFDSAYEIEPTFDLIVAPLANEVIQFQIDIAQQILMVLVFRLQFPQIQCGTALAHRIIPRQCQIQLRLREYPI